MLVSADSEWGQRIKVAGVSTTGDIKDSTLVANAAIGQECATSRGAKGVQHGDFSLQMTHIGVLFKSTSNAQDAIKTSERDVSSYHVEKAQFVRA